MKGQQAKTPLDFLKILQNLNSSQHKIKNIEAAIKALKIKILTGIKDLDDLLKLLEVDDKYFNAEDLLVTFKNSKAK